MAVRAILCVLGAQALGLILLGAALALLDAAGWSTSGWLVIGVILSATAVLVAIGMLITVPDGGLWEKCGMGALSFVILLVFLLLTILLVRAIGGDGADRDQTASFESFLPSLLALTLIFGPLFGALVGLLAWGARRLTGG